MLWLHVHLGGTLLFLCPIHAAGEPCADSHHGYVRAWHVEEDLSLGAAACRGRMQPHGEAGYEILLSLRVAGLQPAWRQSSPVLLSGAAAIIAGWCGQSGLARDLQSGHG